MGGKHKVKLSGFRFQDQNLMPKLDIISKKHKRNRNQEVEWALTEYVNRYEKENGPIILEKDTDTQKSQAGINVGDIHQSGIQNSIKIG